jgi:hypothetical protein
VKSKDKEDEIEEELKFIVDEDKSEYRQKIIAKFEKLMQPAVLPETEPGDKIESNGTKNLHVDSPDKIDGKPEGVLLIMNRSCTVVRKAHEVHRSFFTNKKYDQRHRHRPTLLLLRVSDIQNFKKGEQVKFIQRWDSKRSIIQYMLTDFKRCLIQKQLDEINEQRDLISRPVLVHIGKSISN